MGVAQAAPKKKTSIAAPKGFWKVLVQPNAKWLLSTTDPKEDLDGLAAPDYSMFRQE